MTHDNKFGQCILVLDKGFVFYAEQAAMNPHTGMWQASNLRCIRRWGTEKGLAELVNGPLDSTELDAVCPAMEINDASLLFVIPCTGKWN